MISVSNLSMRFGQQILFEDVSISFKPNCRYGLIGANGSGKSTFMKIMTGQLTSTTGDVAIERDCTLGYLKQDHYEYDEMSILDTVYSGNGALWKLHVEREELYSKPDLTEAEGIRVGDVEEQFGDAGGYTMEADAARLLTGLGIAAAVHDEPMNSLTGGFKLRVLLAQVLFADPDILLMDEPTNHLDMASIEWLVDFLSRRKGTVVVISHDRFFLNSVCTHTADLDYNRIRLFPGNYDDFMTADAMIKERKQKENKKKEKRISDLKEFINRFSANASKARQATSRQKELDKIELDKVKPSSRISPYIRFEPSVPLGDKVIELEAVTKSYDLTLFEDFTCTIAKDEKVGIIGTNGVGKTTLVRMLLKELEPDKGRVQQGETVDFNYFPQDSSELLAGDGQAIDWLARWVPGESITETELRSAMGRMLFRGDDVFKPVNVLSGGERARLILSSMLLSGGNVLVLDEPTNHLDLEAIEALNYGLSLVETAVVFVSHDREFVNSLATRIIHIGEDGIIDYPGTLDDFEDMQRRQKRKK
jgi:ATPase subunit of ABC transporter with duplicated ATPase domains